MSWQERADGYFFPQENLSAAIRSKLEILTLEDAAQILNGGTLIPFEKSVLLSEEDAELLNLPPRNPYQISIRTEGYIGARDFRYVVYILNSDGRPFIKPQISGALLRVDEEIFRLTADQFALIELVDAGNKKLSREEVAFACDFSGSYMGMIERAEYDFKISKLYKIIISWK